MSNRKITLISNSSNNQIEVNTNAQTWGELKGLGDVQNLIAGQTVRAIVRDTKVTLDHDDAQLPEGNFILFLVPEKVKSGAEVDTDSVIESLENLKDSLCDLIDQTIEKVENGEYESDTLKDELHELMEETNF